MNAVQKFALIYILLIAAVVYGYMIGEYQVFPAKQIDEFAEFVAWESETADLSLVDKLEMQVGFKPRNLSFDYPEIAVRDASPLALPGKSDRRQDPFMAIDPAHREGYRAVFGAMELEGSFWGGALISPDAEVLHTWKLSTQEITQSDKSDYTIILYGLHLLPDGSVIYILHMDDIGGILVKVDACGELQWRKPGPFHHTVSMVDSGEYFWTYQGAVTAFHQKLAKVDTQTGKVLQRIDLKDVYKASEFTHIFNLSVNPQDVNDSSHGNDVDELQPHQLADFPGFEVGDLLLSYRTHNKIFVIDPDTLQVKWWRMGATARQHDSDWENGLITSFSNNNVGARKGHSDIIAIDPQTMESTVLVNGESIELFSVINARQERTAYGTRMLTSATQGWAVEVDDSGNIVSSFVNSFSTEEKLSSHLAEAYRLEPEYFSEKFWERQCDAPQAQ